jgi:hypothetical protein
MEQNVIFTATMRYRAYIFDHCMSEGEEHNMGSWFDAINGKAARQADYDHISKFAFELIGMSLGSMQGGEIKRNENKISVFASGFIQTMGRAVGLTDEECVEAMLVFLVKQVDYEPQKAGETIKLIAQLQATSDGRALMQAGSNAFIAMHSKDMAAAISALPNAL